MARIIIPLEQMEIIGAGNWVTLRKLTPEQTGLQFPCELIHRNKQDYGGAKCIRLVTDHILDPVEGDSLDGFCQTLRDVGLPNIRMQFLASKRPITYFPGEALSHLTVNYQIESPSGICKPGEPVKLGAIREATEEGGVAKLIRSAALTRSPIACDAGSHVEVYSIQAALVQAGELTPSAIDEGIIPGESRLIPFLEAQSWLYDQQSKGVLVEGWTLMGLAMLIAALLDRKSVV